MGGYLTQHQILYSDSLFNQRGNSIFAEKIIISDSAENFWRQSKFGATCHQIFQFFWQE